jgi:hypothetical protein
MRVGKPRHTPRTPGSARGRLQRQFFLSGMVALLTFGGLPTPVGAQSSSADPSRGVAGAPSQSPAATADPSPGVAFRAGEGPAATVAVGLVASWPLRPRLHFRGEVMKAIQGVAGCEAEFPSSQRCSSSPVLGVLGFSLRQPMGSWALGLDTGAGVHLEEEAFGGGTPLVQLGGAMERNLGPAWVAEATVSWSRARNHVWEVRLGEPLEYVLVGVGLRRRWSR